MLSDGKNIEYVTNVETLSWAYTEPPSISCTGRKVIVASMILHIEPKIERDYAVFQLDGEGFNRTVFISAHSPKSIPRIL